MRQKELKIKMEPSLMKKLRAVERLVGELDWRVALKDAIEDTRVSASFGPEDRYIVSQLDRWLARHLGDK